MASSEKINELLSISLENITEHYQLSVRGYNVCDKNALHNLGAILSYYKTYKTFLNLDNIGSKTNEELIKICETSLSDNTISSLTSLNELSSNPISKVLSPIQKNIINQTIKKEITNLSTRATNVLNEYCYNNIDLKTLHNLFNNRSTLKQLKSIGRKTEIEISHFLDTIELTIENIFELTDEDILIRQFSNILTTAYNLNDGDIFNYKSSIEKRHFPLFNFINWLANSNKFLDNRELCIMRYRLGYFLNEEMLTLDELGEKFSLTRERMRQISNRTEKNLSEKLIFFHEIKNELTHFINYSIDFSKDIIHIPLSFVRVINEKEKCSFSSKFMIRVFGQIYFDRYYLLGTELTNFKNTYLINRELSNQFDFNGFFNTIDIQVNEDIDEDFLLDFEGYLHSFFISKNNFSLLYRIKDVCENLLSYEYTEEIEIDWSGNIIFKRNTRTRSYELVENILEEKGEAMKLQEIYQRLIDIDPKFAYKDIESLRSQIGKEKDIFIYFGRSSTYGLLKWEKERQDVKGGTIRDIAEDYLKQFNEPKHILEITEVIIKFRPNTNANNVNTNLQLNKDRFKEIGYGFWGLPSMNYDSFTYQKVPKFLNRRIYEFKEQNPEITESELINIFAEKYNLKKVQIQYYIQNNLDESKLKEKTDN